MLYKLKQAASAPTTFVPVLPTTLAEQGYVEKTMETWLSENPHAVLPEDERVLVISQEGPFENRVDILAVDPSGNLVVIEIKRGQTPRDVIAQALEYASDVATWDYQRLNARATFYLRSRGSQCDSLLGAFQETFAQDPEQFTESDFNHAQRIFIVAESIEPKIVHTARWLLARGVDISCIRYECYRADDGDLFLDFQPVVQGSAERAEVKPSIRSSPPSEEEFLDRLSPELRRQYEALKQRVLRFGSDVEAGAAPGYLKFTAGHNFAELHPNSRRGRFTINVKGDNLGLGERESGVFSGLTIARVPDTYMWPLNHRFVVDATADLDAVETVLRQSYETVRGKL